MSLAPRSARSFERIETADLCRLARIARERIEAAFARHPARRALYANELLAICLCQGAADHFLDPEGGAGVHDFDLWAFFARREGARLWNRKPFTADFGPSNFGRSPLDPAHYAGRRVDVLWRCIEAEGDGLAAVRRYFADGQTASAKALRLKAAVVAWPEAWMGEVVWQPLPHRD